MAYANSICQTIFHAVEIALSCRVVPVHRGWFALVDEEDYESVSKHLWFLSAGGYAIRNGPGGRASPHQIMMHRAIVAPPDEMEVDHVNHIKLDNRRQNLRSCQPSENRKNLPRRRDNTTGFKGVYRRGNRWKAQLTVDGKHHFLGGFATPGEAARAYDAAAVEYFGEFASLNFPQAVNA